MHSAALVNADEKRCLRRIENAVGIFPAIIKLYGRVPTGELPHSVSLQIHGRKEHRKWFGG